MMIDPKEERKLRTLIRHIAVDYVGYYDAPYEMFDWAAWFEGSTLGYTIAEHSSNLERMATNFYSTHVDGSSIWHTGILSPEEHEALVRVDPVALGRDAVSQVERVRELTRNPSLEEKPFKNPGSEALYAWLGGPHPSRLDTVMKAVHKGMTEEETEALGRQILDEYIFEMDEYMDDEREFMDKWPDLYRYSRDFSGMSLTEFEKLVGKAGDRFATALLSRKTLTGEECDSIVWLLCDWAYAVGAYDKVRAMYLKGRLFSDTFPAFVTMDDRPDYETVGKWTEKSVSKMNEIIIRRYSQMAAEDALDEVENGDREPGLVPDIDDRLDTEGLMIDYPECGVSRIVAVVRSMQQEGMKAGLRLFHEYWEKGPEQRSHALKDLDSLRYFEPVESEDPQA